MVMGGDSRSKGQGFESQRRILDGHDIFSHRFVVKIVLFVERPKINEKEAEDGPFFFKKKKLLESLFSLIIIRTKVSLKWSNS